MNIRRRICYIMHHSLAKCICYVNDSAESTLSNGELHLYTDHTTAFVIGNLMDQVIQLLKVLFKEIIQWYRVK